MWRALAWRRWGAIGAGILVVLVGVGLCMSPRREAPSSTGIAAPLPAAVPAPPRIEATGGQVAALGSLLSDTPAFADDVVFLVIASLRGRCEPAHAHELSAMAARARLPLLAGVTEAIGKDTARRDALLGTIRDIAARAPCDGRFEMLAGRFHASIDPSAYAAAFPDSYFEPELDTVPEGFAGSTLAERAGDDCRRVAYAMLPLDEPRAWQCAALRAGARQRVVSLCHDANGNADDAALRIRASVDRLPTTCR